MRLPLSLQGAVDNPQETQSDSWMFLISNIRFHVRFWLLADLLAHPELRPLYPGGLN